MAGEVAILGVGMHPWGKWGKNFVEYGIKACQDALTDAGFAWKDIQFISGADTVRCGYPGYVAGATFAQAPHAETIRLVLDNLNTHTPGSFYAAMPPEEAFELANRI